MAVAQLPEPKTAYFNGFSISFLKSYKNQKYIKINSFKVLK
jgi:hypothetical protein